MQFRMTLRPGGVSTKCAVLMLVLLASACGTARPSLDAVCVRTAESTNAHGAALLVEGVPDAVVITGDRLIAELDAGCAR